MPYHDAGSGNRQDQRHTGFPDTTGILYRRDQVCSDDCDNRRKHGIYESILEAPNRSLPARVTTLCAKPRRQISQSADWS